MTFSQDTVHSKYSSGTACPSYTYLLDMQMIVLSVYVQK